MTSTDCPGQIQMHTDVPDQNRLPAAPPGGACGKCSYDSFAVMVLRV